MNAENTAASTTPPDEAPESEATTPTEESPLFSRYVVKVDVSVCAAAVPTGRPPTGY